MISEGQKLEFDPVYPPLLANFFARYPDQADRLKMGLINLLKADDDAFIKFGPGAYTEDDSEHYAQAIDLVSSLDDERAIPALVGAMTTGGMATGGLLKYGQKALGPVLNELNDKNPLVRSTAVAMAIAILKMKNDPSSLAQILGLIRMAIRDPEFLLRSAALYAIDDLAEDREEFVPVLQDMAEHDPFTISRENRYPMRDRAKSLLEKIASH